MPDLTRRAVLLSCLGAMASTRHAGAASTQGPWSVAAPLPFAVQEIYPAAFADRIVGMLNEAALSMMTSIGHRTGLFDTMAAMPASTTQQIADKAGLEKRYVREWLDCMVTGCIIEYDPQSKCYLLPAEHAR